MRTIKKITFCCAAFLCIGSTLWAQNDFRYDDPITDFFLGYEYPPNILVENQLTPEIYKIEQSFGLKAGSLRHSGIEDRSFKHNVLSFSASPFAPISKPHHQLYLGFGFTQDQYSSIDSETLSDTLQNLNTFQVNAFLNTRIANSFYWSTYVQAGLNGTEPFSSAKESFNLLAASKINWKISSNMNTALGIAYISNLGSPVMFPAITFAYSTENMVLNFDFPIKAEIEGVFLYGKIRPVVGISFPAATWYNKDVDQNINFVGMNPYVGVRYMILPFISLYGAVLTTLSEEYEIGLADDLSPRGNFTNDVRFTFGINMQIAKFTPYILRKRLGL
jgi:hypothetical protein